MIIGDDKSCNINIRQSALIHVKNAIIDVFKSNLVLPKNDYDAIKSSILQGIFYLYNKRSFEIVSKN